RGNRPSFANNFTTRTPSQFPRSPAIKPSPTRIRSKNSSTQAVSINNSLYQIRININPRSFKFSVNLDPKRLMRLATVSPHISNCRDSKASTDACETATHVLRLDCGGVVQTPDLKCFLAELYGYSSHRFVVSKLALAVRSPQFRA